MEQGLRDCCRSIRIGKILVESDAETHVAKVVYARFPGNSIFSYQSLPSYSVAMLFRWHFQASSIAHVPNYVNRQHSCSGETRISNLFIRKLKSNALIFAGSECPEGARRSRVVHHFIEPILHTASSQNNCHRISSHENSHIRASSSGTQSFWPAILWHRLNSGPTLWCTNTTTIDHWQHFIFRNFIH